MLKIIFLSLILIHLCSTLVKEKGQCGGVGYLGEKTCESAFTCVLQSVWYSECLKTSSIPPTKRSFNVPLCSTFPNGRFRKGISFDQIYKVNLDNYDYISIWMNTIDSEKNTTDFNYYYQGEMLKTCLKLNKIPLFYAYVIAFEARHKSGLQDCDVSEVKNLCTNGAEYIKNNRNYLVSRYSYQAKNIAKIFGRMKPIIFLIEPDFWQYYGNNKQAGDKLSGDYMRKLFDDFVQEIKTQLPNAIISWDISAWIKESGMQKWWSFFQSSPYISFIHTSGGQGHAELNVIKPNELSWKFMYNLTGKKIIADCGYGVSGSLDTSCKQWSISSNQNSRIADGVIALTIANENGEVARPNVKC